MGATCRNPECRYSAAFKEKTKVPAASLCTSESGEPQNWGSPDDSPAQRSALASTDVARSALSSKAETGGVQG
jgi:hypothetical protein